jgi:hypothetical protein
VPAAPINLRKSLRDNPSDFFASNCDIQAEILAKLVINLIQLLFTFLLDDKYEGYQIAILKGILIIILRFNVKLKVIS